MIPGETTPQIQPEWDGALPFCRERCPSNDGKRCGLTGFRTQSICEPAVRAMGETLTAAREALVELGRGDLVARIFGP